MSTAVLYSGQARTIAQCLPTQHWCVYRHFPDLHFFVVWQNDPNAVAGVKLLEDKYGKDRVHAKLIEDPTDLPLIPLHYGEHAPYSNMGVTHKQLLMQHWYQLQVWLECRGSFDTVIRMRGDNFFHRCELQTRNFYSKFRVESPWWGRFGGINDRFALMDYRAASAYFSVFDHIQELLEQGCPFHPETLLKETLAVNAVAIIDTLRAEFSTLRLDGTMRRWESEVGPDVSQFVSLTRQQ